MPYRQSLVRADVTVGVGPSQTPIHIGIADKWDGGDGDSDIGSYMRASGEQTLGGPKTRDDATATFLVDEAFWAIWPELDRGRGSLRASISLVPTGDDGTPFATGPVTLNGTLKTVPTPQGDFSSNEGNAVGLVFKMDADRA